MLVKLVCAQKCLNFSGFGDCYIKINADDFFPDEKWEDFCLYIINGWLSDLETNKMLKVAIFSLHFMDGPYYLLCKKESEDMTIQGMKEGIETPFFIERIKYAVFLNLVYDAARMVLKKMQEKGVFNRDVSTLTSYLNNTGDVSE